MSQTHTSSSIHATLAQRSDDPPHLLTRARLGSSVFGNDRTVVALTAIVLAIGIIAIHRINVRSYIGFHGPTHTAITFSVLRGNIPPTNPLAADLPLPYYWGYHVVLAAIVRVLGCPPVAAAEGVNVASIIALSLLFCSLARRYLGDVRAGVLAVILVLFAMNPMGPLILLYRVLDGTVGLSIGAFTRSPTHPMLRAMFPDNDIRWTGAFFFFMQPSSRPLAMVAGLLTAGLVCRAWSSATLSRCIAIAIATAFACAMQPIVGTGTALGLSTGVVIVRWLRRADSPLGRTTTLRILASLGAGVVLAFPTFRQLLNGDLVGLPIEHTVQDLAMKGMSIFVLLAIVPLTLTALAARRGLLRRPELQVLAIAGITLVLTSWITRVPGHREHSFFNMGTFLLALPAAAACGWSSATRPGGQTACNRTVRRTLACILPVVIVTLAAFLYRRPIPLESDGILIRDPRDEARVAAYAWIATNTESDALVVFDTRDGEQSAYYGVESDIPAMTGRFLFVDVIDWFIPKLPEIAERCDMVAVIFDGEPLSQSQHALLDRLDKPLYALTRAEDEAETLTATTGQPLFRAGRFALYRLR